MVFSTELFRNHARIRSLIKICVLKSNRESLHRSRAGSSHQCNNRRGICAPAQKSAKGPVTHRPHAHSLGKPLLESIKAFLFRSGQIRPVLWQIPVLAKPSLSSFKFEEMSGRQFLNP